MLWELTSFTVSASHTGRALADEATVRQVIARTAILASGTVTLSRIWSKHDISAVRDILLLLLPHGYSHKDIDRPRMGYKKSNIFGI